MRLNLRISFLQFVIICSLVLIGILTRCMIWRDGSQTSDMRLNEMRLDLRQLVEPQRMYAERNGQFAQNIADLHEVMDTIYVSTDISLYITFVDMNRGWRGLAESRESHKTCEIEVGSAVQMTHKPAEPYC